MRKLVTSFFNSKLFVDYLITFLTYGATIITNALFYYILTAHLGESGFEEYMLSRRVFAIFMVTSMLGIAVALPRELSRRFDAETFQTTANLFIASLLIILSSMTVFLLLFLIFDEKLAYLFWGNQKYTYLLYPIISLMGSMAINSLIFALLRGKMMMGFANSLTLITALLPIFLIFFVNKIPIFLYLQSALTLFISILFIYFSVDKKTAQFKFDIKTIVEELKTLLKFGVPRVPGDLSFEALTSLPVFFTAHLLGTTEASYLAFGLTIMSMIGSALAPFNLILLPLVSSKLKNNDYKGIESHISKLLKFIIPGAIIMSIIIFFSSGLIVKYYLHSSNINASDTIKYVSILLIPYILYMFLRSANDSFYSKPVNSINCIIALCIFCVTYLITYLLYIKFSGVLISLTASIFALGGLTVYFYRKFLFEKRNYHPLIQ
jgi:O-antigen/teichoic acid export membrane protein